MLERPRVQDPRIAFGQKPLRKQSPQSTVQQLARNRILNSKLCEWAWEWIFLELRLQITPALANTLIVLIAHERLWNRWSSPTAHGFLIYRSLWDKCKYCSKPLIPAVICDTTVRNECLAVQDLVPGFLSNLASLYFPVTHFSLTTLPLSILFGHTKIIPTAWTFSVSHVWHVLTPDLRMTVLSYFQALFQ